MLICYASTNANCIAVEENYCLWHFLQTEWPLLPFLQTCSYDVSIISTNAFVINSSWKFEVHLVWT